MVRKQKYITSIIGRCGENVQIFIWNLLFRYRLNRVHNFGKNFRRLRKYYSFPIAKDKIFGSDTVGKEAVKTYSVSFYAVF